MGLIYSKRMGKAGLTTYECLETHKLQEGRKAVLTGSESVGKGGLTTYGESRTS